MVGCLQGQLRSTEIVASITSNSHQFLTIGGCVSLKLLFRKERCASSFPSLQPPPLYMLQCISMVKIILATFTDGLSRVEASQGQFPHICTQWTDTQHSIIIIINRAHITSDQTL